MSKYDRFRYLKRTKARTTHQCARCKDMIAPDEYYYVETIDDKFLQSLHAKRFCAKCHKKYGESLLFPKKEQKKMNEESGPLNNFL